MIAKKYNESTEVIMFAQKKIAAALLALCLVWGGCGGDSDGDAHRAGADRG